MAWSFEGTYFENCNCDTICPCSWSGFTAPATHDRCRALLNFHIENGQVNGVDVSGLTFGILLDTPPVMIEGNWRVGVLLDDQASQDQAEQLGAVISGQQGGPPAMLSGLIGEMLGVESLPVTYEDDGLRHRVRWGDVAQMEVEDHVAGTHEQPVRLQNAFHPANTTLTVARATNSTVSLFGVDFGESGTNGLSAPFAWSGE